MGDRRDFFRKLGQFSCLSLLAGGTAYFAAERRIALDGCSENRFCRQCNKLPTCSLEPARNQRIDPQPLPTLKNQ